MVGMGREGRLNVNVHLIVFFIKSVDRTMLLVCFWRYEYLSFRPLLNQACFGLLWLTQNHLPRCISSRVIEQNNTICCYAFCEFILGVFTDYSAHAHACTYTHMRTHVYTHTQADTHMHSHSPTNLHARKRTHINAITHTGRTLLSDIKGIGLAPLK